MSEQIPPAPPLEKGETGSPTPPFSKGGQGGIPPPLTLNHYAPHLKPYARELRRHQTEAEQKLWFHLRRDQSGVRFYRQRPLGAYIVDFYAPKAKLVIELDGSQHFEPAHHDRDAVRDAWLRSRGLTVLRFDDRQALTETPTVLEVILAAVQQALADEIPPNPPLEKGGEAAVSRPLKMGGEESAASPPLKRGARGDSTTTPPFPPKPDPCASYSSPTPSTA